MCQSRLKQNPSNCSFIHSGSEWLTDLYRSLEGRLSTQDWHCFRRQCSVAKSSSSPRTWCNLGYFVESSDFVQNLPGVFRSTFCKSFTCRFQWSGPKGTELSMFNWIGQVAWRNTNAFELETKHRSVGTVDQWSMHRPSPLQGENWTSLLLGI